MIDRYVVHVPPDADPNDVPGVLGVVVDGRQGPWEPAALAERNPVEAAFVLETEWRDADGQYQRTKAIDVLDGATILAENIVGHRFAGDE